MESDDTDRESHQNLLWSSSQTETSLVEQTTTANSKTTLGGSEDNGEKYFASLECDTDDFENISNSQRRTSRESTGIGGNISNDPGRTDRLRGNRRGDRHRQGRTQFRLRGKSFLLTWPKCPHEGGVAAAVSKCTNLGAKRYLVCKELHADGDQHLHCFIELPANREICRANFFDLEFGGCEYHGNYQVVRSASRAASYVVKDGDYVSYGFSEDELRKLKRLATHKSSDEIAGRLLKGERIETVVLENPGMLIRYDLDRIQLQADRVRNFNNEFAKRSLTNISLFNYKYVFNPIAPCRGPGGNLHIWLWGQPGCGKSTLFKSSGFRPYYVDDVNNWAMYDDNMYDFILFDDCVPNLLHKFGFAALNRLLDGNADGVRMNKKHGFAYVLKKMPIFFVSNWNILECHFPGDSSFSAFLSRLNILECTRTPYGNTYANISVLNNPHQIK